MDINLNNDNARDKIPGMNILKDENKKESYMTDLKFLIILIGALASVFVSLFLMYRYISNAIYVAGYRNDNIKLSTESRLTVFNYPQGYVPYYNLGNGYYKSGDYSNASNHFLTALNYTASEDERCDMRINLTLSVLAGIDYEYVDEYIASSEVSEELQTEIDSIVEKLSYARTLLCAEGCANENDEGGHNEEAITLRNEIDDLLEKLSKDSESDSDEQEEEEEQQEESEEEEEEDDSNSMSMREQNIKDRLKENQQDAMEQRSQTRQYYDGISNNDGEGSGEYNYTEKNW